MQDCDIRKVLFFGFFFSGLGYISVLFIYFFHVKYKGTIKEVSENRHQLLVANTFDIPQVWNQRKWELVFSSKFLNGWNGESIASTQTLWFKEARGGMKSLTCTRPSPHCSSDEGGPWLVKRKRTLFSVPLAWCPVFNSSKKKKKSLPNPNLIPAN